MDCVSLNQRRSQEFFEGVSAHAKIFYHAHTNRGVHAKNLAP